MDNLYIEATQDTPEVNFDATTGILEISGKSLPENIKEFYAPVNDWITDYGQQPQPLTLLKMRMEYFNTASSKAIMDLLELLNIQHKNGHEVKVEWHYQIDDEDMQETGQDYAGLLSMRFDIIAHQ